MKHARRKVLLAVIGVVLALVALGFVLDGISRWRFAKNWPIVQMGMSKDQVESLLGAPASVYPAYDSTSDSIVGTWLEFYMFDSWYEKWAYGRRRLLATQPQFPFVGLAPDTFLKPAGDDYVVYFSAKGKVVQKVHPYHRSGTK